jgi:hypothetical protein
VAFAQSMPVLQRFRQFNGMSRVPMIHFSFIENRGKVILRPAHPRVDRIVWFDESDIG